LISAPRIRIGTPTRIIQAGMADNGAAGESLDHSERRETADPACRDRRTRRWSHAGARPANLRLHLDPASSTFRSAAGYRRSF
jgi:hypothetical protein